jgi:hypothetical protein
LSYRNKPLKKYRLSDIVLAAPAAILQLAAGRFADPECEAPFELKSRIRPPAKR